MKKVQGLAMVIWGYIPFGKQKRYLVINTVGVGYSVGGMVNEGSFRRLLFSTTKEIGDFWSHANSL